MKKFLNFLARLLGVALLLTILFNPAWLIAVLIGWGLFILLGGIYAALYFE